MHCKINRVAQPCFMTYCLVGWLLKNAGPFLWSIKLFMKMQPFSRPFFGKPFLSDSVSFASTMHWLNIFVFETLLPKKPRDLSAEEYDQYMAKLAQRELQDPSTKINILVLLSRVTGSMKVKGIIFPTSFNTVNNREKNYQTCTGLSFSRAMEHT